MIDISLPSPLMSSSFDFGCNTLIKRDDLIHPEVSGNKYRKLRYIIDEAKQNDCKGIITFGGAFSNHIYATAAYASLQRLKTVGIIRGEDDPENPMLIFARDRGMILHFVRRDEYRLKENSIIIKEITDSYDEYTIIPEGGDHPLALNGVEELINEIKNEGILPEYIAVSAGTGTTAAGLLKGIIKNKWHTKLLVLSALRNKNLAKEILSKANGKAYAHQMIFMDEYSGAGYAKTDQPLIDFMNRFYDMTSIQLDPIYTGKLVFGLNQLAFKGFFKPHEKLVWIHTGGLQGIAGYNYLLKKKGGNERMRIKYRSINPKF